MTKTIMRIEVEAATGITVRMKMITMKTRVVVAGLDHGLRTDPMVSTINRDLYVYKTR